MSVPRWLFRRTVFGVCAVYLVVTALFPVVVFFPPPGAPPPTPGSPRDPATPLLVRYLGWIVDFTTLQWGSFRGTPVTSAIVDALFLTAAYATPAMLVAYPLGIIVGVHSALSEGTVVDRLERYSAYLVFAVPTFFLGIVVLDILVGDFGWYNPFYRAARGPWAPYNVIRLVPPAAVVSVGVVAVGIRHSRAEILDRLDDPYVKRLRSHGASGLLVGRRLLWQVMARILSQFVAELFAVLLPALIAVEVIFGLPGFGVLLLQAALQRSQSLVFAVTAVTVTLGVGGNLLADAVAVLVDPRLPSGAD